MHQIKTSTIRDFVIFFVRSQRIKEYFHDEEILILKGEVAISYPIKNCTSPFQQTSLYEIEDFLEVLCDPYFFLFIIQDM